MIKLDKYVRPLENLICKIEEKIEDLEEKKQAIIDNADMNDREITSAEEKRIDAIDERIEELDEEADDVQNAIDYLRNWTTD